ncbi:uncharacterized protein LOC117651534 [Thrips palmi]|uniref:Uncharacterized protein LOC117651534 n=1 Tax=Thrips palmi TaxID=161013 RepID=A0A6P9A4H6_THRPL|nr:uncharacterized protein LOC117651534 [Thrips palmi]
MEPNSAGQPVKPKHQRKRVASNSQPQTAGEPKTTTVKAFSPPSGTEQLVRPKSRAKRKAVEHLVPEHLTETTSKPKQETRAGEPSSDLAKPAKAQPRGKGKAVKAAAAVDPTEVAKPKGKGSAKVVSTVKAAKHVTENAKKPSTQQAAAKRPRKDQAPGKAGLGHARSRALESERTAVLEPSRDGPLITKMADRGSEPGTSKHLESVPEIASARAKPKLNPRPLKFGTVGRTKADVQRGYHVDVPPPYRIRKRTKGASGLTASNKGRPWCANCAAEATAGCAAHELLSVAEARRRVAAALTAAERAMRRLDALELREGPRLACTAELEGHGRNKVVVTLSACCGDLAAGERDALCAFLADLTLCPEDTHLAADDDDEDDDKDDDERKATAVAVAAVWAKLPERPPGVKLQPGAVLVLGEEDVAEDVPGPKGAAGFPRLATMAARKTASVQPLAASEVSFDESESSDDEDDDDGSSSCSSETGSSSDASNSPGQPGPAVRVYYDAAVQPHQARGAKVLGYITGNLEFIACAKPEEDLWGRSGRSGGRRVHLSEAKFIDE